MSTYTVSDLLLDRIYEAGAGHIFGVPGDYALGIFARMESHQIQYVGCCNELNAGYAADGYARIRGLGVVAVTYGVGDLSAVNAIGGAFCEKVPIILISGYPTVNTLKNNLCVHHYVKHASTPYDVYKTMTIDQILLDDSKTALEKIDSAIQKCFYYSQPIYIAIPCDIALETVSKPQSPFSLFQPTLSYVQQNFANPNIVAYARWILKSLADATRPLILFGEEAGRYNGLAECILYICKRLNIPFATSWSGKQCIKETHNLCIGVYSGYLSDKSMTDYIENSDGLLIIGYPVIDNSLCTNISQILESNETYWIKQRENGGLFKGNKSWYKDTTVRELIETMAYELRCMDSTLFENNKFSLSKNYIEQYIPTNIIHDTLVRKKKYIQKIAIKNTPKTIWDYEEKKKNENDDSIFGAQDDAAAEKSRVTGEYLLDEFEAANAKAASAASSRNPKEKYNLQDVDMIEKNEISFKNTEFAQRRQLIPIEKIDSQEDLKKKSSLAIYNDDNWSFLWNDTLRRSENKNTIIPVTSIRINDGSNFVIEKNKELTVERLVSCLASYLQPSDILLTDTGCSSFSFKDIAVEADIVSQGMYMSIGYTVPASLGVCYALNEKYKTVFALVGDGAFIMTAQEISSFQKTKLPCIMVIINNGGYTIERMIVDGKMNDIPNWNYRRLTEAFGLTSCTVVTDEVQFKSQLDVALNNIRNGLGLQVIEARTKMDDGPVALQKNGVNVRSKQKLNVVGEAI